MSSSPEFTHPWPVRADQQAGPDPIENFVADQRQAAAVASPKIAEKGPDRQQVGLSDEDRTKARELATAYVRLKAEGAAAKAAEAHDDLIFLLKLAMGSNHQAAKMADVFIELAGTR